MRDNTEHRLEAELKARLMRALRRDSSWGMPFGRFIDFVRKHQLSAFLFGGTVRDILLLSPTVPPRDLDLVVEDSVFDFFLNEFPADSKTRNRFGGLKCSFNTVEIDVWPLHRTWAFQKGYRTQISFRALPTTAFFNLDAIVAEIAPRRGKPREVFECGFFDGVIKRCIDYNLELTDYPELNAIRGFVLAQRTGFHFSNRFSKFLFNLFVANRNAKDLEELQLHHYKRVRLPNEVLFRNLDELRRVLNKDPSSTFLPKFPRTVQTEFHFEPDLPWFEFAQGV